MVFMQPEILSHGSERWMALFCRAAGWLQVQLYSTCTTASFVPEEKLQAVQLPAQPVSEIKAIPVEAQYDPGAGRRHVR